MSEALRIIKPDDLKSILLSHEFIVVEPISPQVFIYELGGDDFVEKEVIEIEEAAISKLEEWVESKIIIVRDFKAKPASYYYDIWFESDGERPESAREQASALGLV